MTQLTKNTLLQDNPLLAKLKQNFQAKIPRVEGVVKGTDKGFGFLETENSTSYFIPPPQMKKVMHGDRIVALLHNVNDRDSVEPQSLLEPFLHRFVGKVGRKHNRLQIIPDHPLLRTAIVCQPNKTLTHQFQEGDWAVAEMRRHPLQGGGDFYAEITAFIASDEDPTMPWKVTLSRHQLEQHAPEATVTQPADTDDERRDLTAYDFFTIDSASTEDMDDALHIALQPDGTLCLYVAIADPTAWIASGSELDKIAAERAFTNYLPGYNIPMLPRVLSDDLCSLRPHVKRRALVCQVAIMADGSLAAEATFFPAWVTSKARLIYDDVSDWLEGNGSWQPPTDAIAQQLGWLHQLCQVRIRWRQEQALMFKERLDYRFILDENNNVIDIAVETRRIANCMVEEAMIAANLCAARYLSERLGAGIFNLHTGFDAAASLQVKALLASQDIEVDAQEIASLEGFKALRRKLDNLSSPWLESRVRRLQNYATIGTKPGPHFGLGFPYYATWTSPIRKYGDMINHRLIKALIKGESITMPVETLTTTLSERRRLYRMAERDIGDWLHCRFLATAVENGHTFRAEVVDVSRGGMRVRLLENGAMAFIPGSYLHPVRDELICNVDQGTISINQQTVYRVTDIVDVTLQEVRVETRTIIARPIA